MVESPDTSVLGVTHLIQNCRHKDLRGKLSVYRVTKKCRNIHPAEITWKTFWVFGARFTLIVWLGMSFHATSSDANSLLSLIYKKVKVDR